MPRGRKRQDDDLVHAHFTRADVVANTVRRYVYGGLSLPDAIRTTLGDMSASPRSKDYRRLKVNYERWQKKWPARHPLPLVPTPPVERGEIVFGENISSGKVKPLAEIKKLWADLDKLFRLIGVPARRR